MKSWIVLLSASMLSAALFILFITTEPEINSKNIKRSQASINEVSKIADEDSFGPLRSIAAISPQTVTPKSQFIGLKEKDLGRYPQSNKRTADWREKFLKRLKKNNKEIPMNTVKIKHKRSIIKKENNSSRNLEHVVVRLKSSNGNPYSYEALVDSETGSMIQSWNKTRYEHREPTILDGTNKLLLRSK